MLGKKQIDDEMLEQLEDQLLMADVGIQATQKITSRLTESLQRKQLGDNESLIGALKNTMIEISHPCHPAEYRYQQKALRDTDGGRQRRRQDHHCR